MAAQFPPGVFPWFYALLMLLVVFLGFFAAFWVTHPKPRRAQAPKEVKRNLRLALILASVVAVFFVGFISKSAVFGI